MKEVNVIYWSSTGNTQAMAEAVGGVEEAGGKANVIEVSAADASMLKDADSCTGRFRYGRRGAGRRDG